MNRRRVLKSSPLALGLLTGCLGGPEGSDGSGETDQTDEEPTESPTPTHQSDTQTTTPMETEFKVIEVRTSSEEESASVAFDDGTVTVTGAISGSNGCYTARLDEVVRETDRLIVRVESYEDADTDQDCTQAAVIIEYRAVVPVDSPLESVSVEHNGEVIASDEQG